MSILWGSNFSPQRNVMEEFKFMKKKTRGVITVEAALVMPIILATLFLLYSLAIIQYNNIVARSEAMRVANRVASNWNLIGGEWDILDEELKKTTENKTGKNVISSDSFKEHDPYRALLELGWTNSSKREPIEEYMTQKMKEVASVDSGLSIQSSTSEPESPDSTIENDAGWNLFNRYVSVKIDNSYNNPIFEWLANMGFPQKETYSVTAKAKLTEPVEFVRNISFLQELLRELN